MFYLPFSILFPEAAAVEWMWPSSSTDVRFVLEIS
jgi:hypothetical protein